jgi:hypothetical protein
MPAALATLPHQIDHIRAQKHRGPSSADNLCYACAECNLHKLDHMEGEDVESGLTVRLYHPRSDVWDSHFRVDAHVGTIEGRTPVGRATVSRPQINSAQQVASRRQWLRLGLFP